MRFAVPSSRSFAAMFFRHHHFTSLGTCSPSSTNFNNKLSLFPPSSIQFRPFCSQHSEATPAKLKEDEEKELANYKEQERKYQLRRVEKAFEDIIPKLMKNSIMTLYPLFAEDFVFEDKVRDVTCDKSRLPLHVAKLRIKLNFKNPYRHFETVGTHICLDEGLVSVIWRLTRNKDTVSAYTMSPWTLFLQIRKTLATIALRHRDKLHQTAREQHGERAEQLRNQKPEPIKQEEEEEPENKNMLKIEECLDIHVDKTGLIKRVINRPVSAYDYELVKLREAEKGIEKEEREQGKRPPIFDHYRL